MASAREYVNVADQRRDPDSLLAFVTLLIRRYRECPELGWGAFEVARAAAPGGTGAPLHLGRRIACCCCTTWGPTRVTVPLRLADRDDTHRLVDLLAGLRPSVLDRRGGAEIALEGYGYRWLRIDEASSRRIT